MAITRNDAAALIPEEVAAQIIDSLPATSAVFGNPLVTTQTMSTKTTRQAVLSMLPSAYWVDGDDGTIDTSSAAFANVYVEAAKLGVIVPVPRDVLDDASFSIWDAIAPKITEAIAAKIDRAVLVGDANAPSFFPTSLAERCVSAGHLVTVGTGVDVADDLNSVFGLVEADGFAVNGIVARMSLKAALRGLRTQDGALVYQPAGAGVANASSDAPTVYGEPVIYASNGVFGPVSESFENPLVAVAGAWENVFLGIRRDIEATVLTEATVGGVSLAETDQVALKVTFRAGWNVLNPQSRENPDDETRFPFAVLANPFDESSS